MTVNKIVPRVRMLPFHAMRTPTTAHAMIRWSEDQHVQKFVSQGGQECLPGVLATGLLPSARCRPPPQSPRMAEPGGPASGSVCGAEGSHCNGQAEATPTPQTGKDHELWPGLRCGTGRAAG